MRGKRLTALDHPKLATDQIRMPLSALNVDLWGCDIDESPLVFKTGDADGFLRPTERGLLPMPWLTQKSALVPMWMFNENGTPFSGDPRHALAQVLDRFAKRGWQVIAATELEFYLVDDSGSSLLPVINPTNKRRLNASDTLSLQQLDDFDAFFSDLYQSCDTLGIAAQTATSECGVGQFEMSISHCDAMRMADDTWLFKTLVKGLARKHGMAATFMAKPHQGQPGSSMHIHQNLVSIKTNKNIFSDDEGKESDAFYQYIGGLQTYLPDAMVFFAPYVNSYRRFVIDASAPINTHWGFENRTVGLRVPLSAPESKRVENRIPGADTNPYLAIAASLACGYLGIKEALEPEKPIAGSGFERRHNIPKYLPDAIERIKVSDSLSEMMGEDFITLYAEVKQTEHDAYQNVISAWERDHLLLNV